MSVTYVTLPDGTVIATDGNGNILPGSLPVYGGGSNVPVPGTTYVTPTPTVIPSSGGSSFSLPSGSSIAKPIANFTYTVYANGSVGFINTSLGNVSAALWRFGDGAISTSPRVLHQYSTIGTYQVTLTVSNSSGSSTITIAVNVTTTAYTVGFTFVVSNTTVQFTDTSTRPGSRIWDFGDGQSSVENNPYHAYASNGVYQASLIIDGVSITHQVVVDRGVRLDWQDNSSDETGFKVERSPNGSTGWTEIATTAANVYSLLVTQNIHGVDPTAVNYFRVRATNADGDSGWSNVTSSIC